MNNDVKYMIILGSNYQEDTEYNLPRIIGDNDWIIYSIDIIKPEKELVEEKKDTHNITIHRWQYDLSKTDITEYLNITNSEVYILDSISCGFITNTSKSLAKYLLGLNNTVLYLHYISPYNADPSLIEWRHYVEYLNVPIDERCKPTTNNPAYGDILEKIGSVIKYTNEDKKNIFIPNLRKSLSTPNHSMLSMESIKTFTVYPFLIKEKPEMNLIRKTIAECNMLVISKLFTKIISSEDISIANLNNGTLYFKESCGAQNQYNIGGMVPFSIVYPILIFLIVILCMQIYKKRKHKKMCMVYF